MQTNEPHHSSDFEQVLFALRPVVRSDRDPTNGFRVQHLSYSSPFYIVFASITATATSAAFAIANLYGRVLELRRQRADTDIAIEIDRQVLQALGMNRAQQALLRESTDNSDDAYQRLLVLTALSRVTGLLVTAEDIHVEPGD